MQAPRPSRAGSRGLLHSCLCSGCCRAGPQHWAGGATPSWRRRRIPTTWWKEGVWWPPWGLALTLSCPALPGGRACASCTGSRCGAWGWGAAAVHGGCFAASLASARWTLEERARPGQDRVRWSRQQAWQPDRAMAGFGMSVRGAGSPGRPQRLCRGLGPCGSVSSSVKWA